MGNSSWVGVSAHYASRAVGRGGSSVRVHAHCAGLAAVGSRCWVGASAHHAARAAVGCSLLLLLCLVLSMQLRVELDDLRHEIVGCLADAACARPSTCYHPCCTVPMTSRAICCVCTQAPAKLEPASPKHRVHGRAAAAQPACCSRSGAGRGWLPVHAACTC
eukprot:696898-Pelagomonas_calceolata.AAC.3